MSNRADAAQTRWSDTAAENTRRAALRLAFGITACFTIVEVLDWDATFLAPMLAANFLVKSPRPPTALQGLLVVSLFALSTGAVLAITAAFISNAAVLLLALTLVLYLGFYAHRRGAPELATLLLQVSAVSLPVVAVLSPQGAGAFAMTLVSAGVLALLTVWAAHAAFPSVPGAEGPPPAGRTLSLETMAARHALVDTLILLPVFVWFILDASRVSVVVLIVIVNVLRQTNLQNRHGAAMGLVLGNLLGGVAAAVTYNLVLLGGTLPIFISICLAASLMFAGKIATSGKLAPVYLIALGTFILLLGLGLSPLPGSSGEAFASRLLNVVVASVYVVCALSLVERKVQPGNG